MKRRWRVWIPGLRAGAGEEVGIEGAEAHHLVRVLRLRAGDEIVAFDGAGEAWLAVLTEVAGEGVRARLERREETLTEPPVRIVLHQGLGRPDRMELIVQKATELGVAAVHFHAAKRSASSGPSLGRLERWRRIAVEAVKQCGGRVVPQVEFESGMPGSPGDSSVGLVFDAGSGALELDQALSSAGRRPDPVHLFVGPESGFEPEEIAGLVAAGWRPVSLGSRILRAETAAVVAVALVLRELGGPGRSAPV